ncbi:MAG: adenylyltransferase/cytidyltransferase family protein [Paracoccaceae bacterium]
MNDLSTERRILTYGSFDPLQIGHVRFLKRLSAMGDRVIVGLSTDQFNSEKGSPSILPFEERREILQSCQYVDHVIPETDWDQKHTDIVNYNISLFAMGEQFAGKYDHLNDITQVLYLPRSKSVYARDPENVDPNFTQTSFVAQALVKSA